MALFKYHPWKNWAVSEVIFYILWFRCRMGSYYSTPKRSSTMLDSTQVRQRSSMGGSASPLLTAYVLNHFPQSLSFPLFLPVRNLLHSWLQPVRNLLHSWLWTHVLIVALYSSLGTNLVTCLKHWPLAITVLLYYILYPDSFSSNTTGPHLVLKGLSGELFISSLINANRNSCYHCSSE